MVVLAEAAGIKAVEVLAQQVVRMVPQEQVAGMAVEMVSVEKEVQMELREIVILLLAEEELAAAEAAEAMAEVMAAGGHRAAEAAVD